jgi:FixJ family two-component response regulator
MFSASDCQREAMIAGADAFLKKPGGIRDLIRTIKRLLEERQSVSNKAEESVNLNSIKRLPSRA